MKIYKDKDGTIYIVAGKDEKEPRVVIAQDGGTGKIHNMFGEPLARFYWHSASVSDNTPYSSRTSCLIKEEDKAYQYKLIKVKRIKQLGRMKGK
jgi:hypothetical protein